MNSRRLYVVAGVLVIAVVSGFVRNHLASPTTKSLPQDAYVWQRSYTPAVDAAVSGGTRSFRRLVLLAAEVDWRDDGPRTTSVRPDYAAFPSGTAVGLAVRVGPLPPAHALSPASPAFPAVRDAVVKAIATARSAGVAVAEVQLDYDCAESKLAGYAAAVRAIRPAVAPVPVVVTALPSWLRRPEFADLATAAEAFVLQVHSLHRPASPADAMTLCDPADARRAVDAAAKVGVPFRVALPTYAYVAGFDGAGKLIGLVAEGPEPAWLAGTTLREMTSDPAEIAGLVRDWAARPPANLSGLIWYRLPVAGDAMNWAMPTLRAVMAGRVPAAVVQCETERPSPGLTDLFAHDAGDGSGSLAVQFVATWGGTDAVAAEGLNGFVGRLDSAARRVTFVPADPAGGRRIAPGERVPIGWIRLRADTEVHTNVSPFTP